MAMEKVTLVSNIGSSSKKYALFSGEVCKACARFERHGEKFLLTEATRSSSVIDQKTFETALSVFLKEKITNEMVVDRVGVRIVSPGSYFSEHQKVTEDFLVRLAEMEARDPVHITPILEELRSMKALLPEAILVAVSDSAFHNTLPQVARVFSLPENLAKTADIYRFGFHGLSLASVVRTFSKEYGKIPAKTIVCHLGSGASITALREGKSVDTSMGYSPLSGVPMSTRSGDIDPGALFRLLELYSTPQTREMLYTEGGLWALSGGYADMRVLLDEADKGNAKAAEAVTSFVYSVQKYIGAYAAALGGIDALIFSGTIGERSAPIRKRVCENMSWIGIVLDEKQNIESVKYASIDIGTVRIYIVPSDEEVQIAHETNAF